MPSTAGATWAGVWMPASQPVPSRAVRRIAAGLLPPEIVPGWYPPAGATYDVLVAALCYLPVLRR